MIKFLVMVKKLYEILKIQNVSTKCCFQQNVALILRPEIEVMTQTMLASTKIKNR